VARPGRPPCADRGAFKERLDPLTDALVVPVLGQ